MTGHLNHDYDGLVPTGSSSPLLSFFVSPFLSGLLTVTEILLSKSPKSSNDAGDKSEWRTIVRWRPCIPNVSKAPPYLFRSAHGVSRAHTQVHANTDALRKKKKRKVSSSPLKAGTLKQLL